MQNVDAEKQLSDFFMQAPVPMVILLGKEHRFLIANPPYEKLIGWSATGKTVLEVFSPEEVGHFVPLLDGVYETGQPYVGKELLLQMKSDDGQVVDHWIDIDYHPFREDDGTIKGILAIVQM